MFAGSVVGSKKNVMDDSREVRSPARFVFTKKIILPKVCRLAFGIAAAALICFAFPWHADAQGQPEGGEIVANLCAGRVVIGVAKDGIVVATLENPVEPDTKPPMIVPVSDQRVAILLGAADWWLPDENRELARIYSELPNLQSGQGRPRGPRLDPTNSAGGGAGSEATDIEQIAQGVRGRLSFVADHIHGNLKLDDDEPLLQLILVDYARDYGAEVWLVKYSVDQEPEQGDFWQTRVLQPHYTQLWPPEKGEPRGLVEVSWPAQATMASLIGGGNARVTQAITGAQGMQEVSAAIFDGQIQKQSAVDVAQFLRTCLEAAKVPNARMIEVEVNEKRGVGWFVRPPAETEAAGSEQAHPAGAPSLRKPGPGR